MKWYKQIWMLSLLVFVVGCETGEKKQEKNSSAATKETTVAASSKKITIDGSVGKLQAILQTPELKSNEKYPLVILMHGVFSNKEFPLITALADQLQAEGIATLRFDFNGHGESDGKFVNMTVPLEVKDAKAVFAYAEKLDFVSSISLVGHSQGGVVASLTAGDLKDKVKSMALFAPAAVLEEQSANGQMMGVHFDPDNIPDYIEVFNHKAGKAYLESNQTLEIYDHAKAYTGPVCIVQGKVDKVVPFAYAEKYDNIYAKSDLHLLPTADHIFSNDVPEASKIGVSFFIKQLKSDK